MKTRTLHSALRPAGFTLVIVLFLLALILIFVVAFAANMRTERKAAYNMSQGQRADLVAEGALAHSISLLASNIPDPGNPSIETPSGAGRNWLVNPGRLTVIDSAIPPNITFIPLHSGEAASQDPNVAVNLNAASATTGEFAITGSNDPMWVSWINVLEDASAPPSNANQIVGRYAFWIDDECAKINFNTARGKPSTIAADVALPANWSATTGRDLHSYLTPMFNVSAGVPYALGQPASVNLDNLGVNIGDLDADVKARGFFQQPVAIKSYATGDPDTFYQQNKFQLTPFSRSPEFNVFGKSRLFMISTASDLAACPFYQHSLHPEQPMLFWGGQGGVGTSTAADSSDMREMREPVVTALAKYLQRNDWPGMETRVFRWMLDPKGRQESDQIALNIASMGYWATTSTDDFGTDSLANAMYRWPVSGAYGPALGFPNASVWKGPLSGRPMLPPFPGPQATEIACTVIPEQVGATANWRLKFQFAMEYYQPPGNYSMDDPDDTPDLGFGYLTDSTTGGYMMKYIVTHFSIKVTSGTGTRENRVINDNPSAEFAAFARPIPGLVPRDNFISQILPTLYVTTVTAPEGSTSTKKASFTGAATVTVKARFAVATRGGSRLTQLVPVYVPAETSAPAELRSPSSDPDDAYLVYTFTIPAAPDYAGYTQSYEVSDPRVLADRASWKLVDPASGDTDSLGFENSESDFTGSGATQWAMWNMNAKDPNPDDGVYKLSRGATAPNFRGSSIGMFSMVPTGMQRGIPMENLRFNNLPIASGALPDWLVLDLIAPTFPSPISVRNSTAGKINLNSKIYPINPNFSPPPRTAPLDALFQYMPNGMQAAEAIREFQESGGYFDYIGRMCEIPEVADASLGATEYEQEALVRHLAGLVTTQSNTFSVWGVAQTVKKVPGNTNYGSFETKDLVTGERRFRGVVERYVWPGKEGRPGNARVTGGFYTKASPDKAAATPLNPGIPPQAPWETKLWAELDGPQQPQVATPLGVVPYNASPLETADNPLAAVMKYRVIFWEYLD